MADQSQQQPGHTYRAYGLVIRSELELPQLPAATGTPDVTVRVGDLAPWPTEQGTGPFHLTVTGAVMTYALEGVGAFSIREGREVVVDGHPGVDEEALRLSVIGPCLAQACEQRGRLVLHASAAGIGGRGVAFVGAHGWGKSTLVGALARRGHTFITDDVLALDRSAAAPLMQPSFPLIKLWPDAARSLGQEPDSLPRLRPVLPKVGLPVLEGVAEGPLALERLYVLAAGESLRLDALAPLAALPEVFQHWYGARFGGPMVKGDRMATAFRDLTDLLGRISVRRITRPPDLDQLDACAELIEQDLAGVA